MSIPVHFAIDLEPDGLMPDPENSSIDSAGDVLHAFKEKRAQLEDRTGATVNFGWYLRLDQAIGACLGDPCAIAKRYENELSVMAAAGDEIGLHIHVFDPNGTNGNWRANYRDASLISDTIAAALENFEKTFGYACRATRMGDMWANQAAIAQLDDAGIRYDLSVERGLRPNHMGAVHPKTGSIGVRPSMIRVPESVYQPDPTDFRVPGAGDKRNIWILPLTSYRRSDPLNFNYLAKACVTLLNAGPGYLPPREVFRPQTEYSKVFLTEALRQTFVELEKPQLCVAARNYRYPERIDQFLNAVAGLAKPSPLKFVTPADYVAELTGSADEKAA